MRSLVAKRSELALWTERSLMLLPAVALVLGVLALLLLVETGYVTSVGYEIQRLERSKTDWQRTNQLMEAEVSKASSLAYVQKQALDRLKMTVPVSYSYVTLDGEMWDLAANSQVSKDMNTDGSKGFRPFRPFWKLLGREG